MLTVIEKENDDLIRAKNRKYVILLKIMRRKIKLLRSTR